VSFLRGVTRVPAALGHHTGSMIRFTTRQLENLPTQDCRCDILLPDGQVVNGRFHRHPANPYIGGRALVRWIKSWVPWNRPLRVYVEQVGKSDRVRLRVSQGGGKQTEHQTHFRKQALHLGRVKRRARKRGEYSRLERDPRIRQALLQIWPARCQVANCDSHTKVPAALRSAIVEVHHITHVSEGGPDSPVNLCLLCANHHGLIHRAPNSKVLECGSERAMVVVNGLTLTVKRNVRDLWELIDV